MKRLLRGFLSLLSGALCCGIIYVWVRSHQTADMIIWDNGRGAHYEIVTIPGQFRFTRVTNWVGSDRRLWLRSPFPPRYPVFGQQLVRQTWLPIGIGFEAGSRRISSPFPRGPFTVAAQTVAFQITAVAFALPALLTGIVAIAALFRGSRSRRRLKERAARGLCPACGYDWRSTPGRCPECGLSAV